MHQRRLARHHAPALGRVGVPKFGDDRGRILLRAPAIEQLYFEGSPSLGRQHDPFSAVNDHFLGP